jgi:hypothetical protein
VIDIHKDWKSTFKVPRQVNPPRVETTNQRIFTEASNVDRKKEEGCMNKIKIERADKLQKEDARSKSYNVISGAQVDRKVWINALGK